MLKIYHYDPRIAGYEVEDYSRVLGAAISCLVTFFGGDTVS
jgi:hypothetical protein